MSTKDSIKEIIDEFEIKISVLKKERKEALDNFKKVVHTKKIEDIKSNLREDASTNCKK